MSQMHVAMIGQRGIPATFGGIERHVEEIGARLVERGHRVDVYCRPGYNDDAPAVYRGMNRIDVATVNTQHLEAFAHSALSTVQGLRDRADVYHYHAIGPGLWSFGPRMFKRDGAVIQTIHGLDFDREKWSAPAQKLLRGIASASNRVPHHTIVVSGALRDQYRELFGRDATYVPNGVVKPDRLGPGPALERFGLEAQRYVLFVGRLVPEKSVVPLLKSFLELETDAKLVIAGGSSYTDDYVQQIEDLAASSDRVLLPGYVYGDDLNELYSNAGLFVLPSTLEGQPLTLLEALAYKLPVIASDLPAHVQVLGESGPGHRIFASGDWQALTDEIGKALVGLDAERLATDGHDELLLPHDWDLVTDQTEAIYRQVLERAVRS